MGLDVIFVRLDGSRIGWDDPIMQQENGFPFPRYEEKYNLYDDDGNFFDERSQFCIAEICGMQCLGTVTFRGRGYSFFASAELPHSFHQNFSPSELKEQATALSAWLEDRKDAPDDERYHGESMRDLRNLSILLNWAVVQGLGTIASY